MKNSVYALDRVVRQKKFRHGLCQNCSQIYSGCTLPDEQVECGSFERYSNSDTYHPKSITHKLGLYVLCPLFGLTCLGIVLSAFEVVLPSFFWCFGGLGVAIWGVVWLVSRRGR